MVSAEAERVWDAYEATLEWMAEHADELRQDHAGKFLVVHDGAEQKVARSFSSRRQINAYLRGISEDQLQSAYVEYVPKHNEVLGM